MNAVEFKETLARTALPVVVEFWAPWCGPCRAMAPALGEAERTFEERVKLLRINADESAGLLDELGVLGIPTLLVYHNGRQLARRTGVQSPADLQTLFESAASGVAPRPTGVHPIDRALRLIASAALFALGLANGPSWVLLAAAGMVGFWAIHDRCPIWRAIRARFAANRAAR